MGQRNHTPLAADHGFSNFRLTHESAHGASFGDSIRVRPQASHFPASSSRCSHTLAFHIQNDNATQRRSPR